MGGGGGRGGTNVAQSSCVVAVKVLHILLSLDNRFSLAINIPTYSLNI